MEILELPCQSTEELVRRSKGVKVLEIIYCMRRGPISKLLSLGGQRKHYNNKDCAGEGEHDIFEKLNVGSPLQAMIGTKLCCNGDDKIPECQSPGSSTKPQEQVGYNYHNAKQGRSGVQLV